MFSIAIAYLESKTPTWLKVCVALVVIGWMAPIKFREWFFTTIDGRVYAVIAPLEKDRDYEIKAINDELRGLNTKSDEINAFVKELAIHSLGPKRYEEVSLTLKK